MKTKELIQKLQEADPEGEMHVNFGMDIVTGFGSAPGYWDGCYYYYDDDGNYVTSTEGLKVQVFSMDTEDFIWDKAERYVDKKRKECAQRGEIYEIDRDAIVEYVKGRFLFKGGSISIAHRQKNIFKKIEEEVDDYILFEKDSSKRFLEKAIKELREGALFLRKKVEENQNYYTNFVDGSSWSKEHQMYTSGIMVGIYQAIVQNPHFGFEPYNDEYDRIVLVRDPEMGGETFESQ